MKYTEITLAEYKALKEERRAAQERKDWERFDELDKRIDFARVIPEPGCPGTVKYYTDYCSGVVAELITPRRLRFTLTGIYSGEYIFTKRKTGAWVSKGDTERGGLRLILGWSHDYRCEEI